jgi:hypothetical protein
VTRSSVCRGTSFPSSLPFISVLPTLLPIWSLHSIHHRLLPSPLVWQNHFAKQNKARCNSLSSSQKNCLTHPYFTPAVTN